MSEFFAGKLGTMLFIPHTASASVGLPIPANPIYLEISLLI
jgi:hypothetical protein